MRADLHGTIWEFPEKHRSCHRPIQNFLFSIWIFKARSIVSFDSVFSFCLGFTCRWPKLTSLMYLSFATFVREKKTSFLIYAPASGLSKAINLVFLEDNKGSEVNSPISLFWSFRKALYLKGTFLIDKRPKFPTQK